MAVFCRWCNFPSEASLAVIWVDRDQESVMIVIRSDVDQMEIYVKYMEIYGNICEIYVTKKVC